MTTATRLDSTVLRKQALGKWRGILNSIGMMLPATANQHGPCPACGGKDRFRFDDQDGEGTWFCNQCQPQAGDGFRLVQNVRGCNFPQALQLVADALGYQQCNGDTPRKIVATYDYTDASGTLLFQAVRYVPKDFRQRRPDGHGGWTWNLTGIEPVLYKLPEVLAAFSVMIVEGEKDVETAYGLGLPNGWAATCNPMGAGKWRDEYSDFLRGKRVVIVPDADKSGQRHAQQVAKSLDGKAVETLRQVLPEGCKDLSEWAEAGGTAGTFRALLETAAPWKPAGGNLSPASHEFSMTPLSVLLSEKEEHVAWLVDQHLPSGGLSLLAGKPKAGKSTLARCLALAVARGKPFLGLPTQQGRVFYLALEEKRAEVRKHFQAMGAAATDEIILHVAPSPQDGLAKLRILAEREQFSLIIVDPLFKLVRVKDGNDYAAMTQAIEPLLSLARETEAHVLAVHHLGKGERDGGDAILGSTAIFAAVDTALLLKRSEKFRTLSSIQRYGEDLEEVTLNMDIETGLISIGPSRKEAEEISVASLILDYLATQAEPVEECVIQENVESRKGTKVKALRRLVEEGKVIRQGGGRKGNPFVYSKAGFLVPSICKELENQKETSNKAPCHSSGNAGSHLFAGFETGPESLEPGSEEVVADET